jgi:Fe-S cluster assembly protein SufD
MMAQPKAEPDSFHEKFEELYAQLSNDPLKSVRSKAWDHYLELGLPTKRHEAFKYLRLRSLYQNEFVPSIEARIEKESMDPFVYPECRNSLIVFVNGYFHPELSQIQALPKKAVLSSLPESLNTFGTFLSHQWAKSIKEETDSFAALNAALHPKGAFLYIPPKTVMDCPIQILHIVDAGSEKMFLMPRLHIFAGAQCEAQLYSSQGVISGRKYAVNMAVDWTIEEEAHINYVQNSWEISPEAWFFDAARATLKRNSTFHSVNTTSGSATVRYDYRVALAGENSEALLNGVWMLSNNKEAHTHVIVDHQAPHCRSMQLFKGVLNDASHSSFEGKILVRQPAQKTEAFQLNNNLLLSDHAAADSKPNLEIFADDVKASHGATVGQLDAEQLFYMKTRGFDEADAKNLLIQGFCQEVLDKIILKSLSKVLSERAGSYIKRG